MNRPPETTWSEVASMAMLAWASTPDVENTRADPDPARPGGDLGQQHTGVVAPPFSEEERVVPELLGSLRDVQHDVAPGFERSQADGKLTF